MPINTPTPRTFVLMGQGGQFTSQGIAALQARISRSSLHSWDDMSPVAIINGTPSDVPVVLIGYSLGANRLEDIGNQARRILNLGVAYDPSRLYGGVRNGKQTCPTLYKRLLCYQNDGAWLYGGSGYSGPRVETTHIYNFHLAVQFDKTLHQKTLKAIGELHAA